jgi:hypothetical protein
MSTFGGYTPLGFSARVLWHFSLRTGALIHRCFHVSEFASEPGASLCGTLFRKGYRTLLLGTLELRTERQSRDAHRKLLSQSLLQHVGPIRLKKNTITGKCNTTDIATEEQCLARQQEHAMYVLQQSWAMADITAKDSTHRRHSSTLTRARFQPLSASGSSPVWYEFHETFSDNLIQVGLHMLRFPKLSVGVSTELH